MSELEIEADKAKLFNDPRTKALLHKMLESGTFKISPSIDLKGINYPLVNEALPDVTPSEIRYLLNSLAKFGILEAKFLDKFVTCPNCSSPSVISRYNCPRCKSIDVSRHSIISHSDCGFTESKSKFETADKLVCPHCKKTLSDADYKEVGIIFECNSCSSRFQAPNTSHKCTMCKVTFTHKDAGYEPIYEYELTEQTKRELSSTDTFMTGVFEAFKERGFDVAQKYEVEGRSGANHTFDLVARQNGYLIVANLVFKVREEDIIGFFAKKYDVDPSMAILISLSPPSPEHLVTSRVYGIHIIFATESHTVAEQIAYILDYSASVESDSSGEQQQGTDDGTAFGQRSSFM